MKTIFDSMVRAELIERIDRLNKDSTAQWGKMNIYQMVKHCNLWDSWILGKSNLKYKQEFLGLIFGKLALKSLIKDDRPIKKNMPAGPNHTVKDIHCDLELEKKIWAERIADYKHFSNPDFIHDFFGKMTVDQIGILAYKHSDHHLRQFKS